MDKDKTISVFRYALAIAAQDDDQYCRQLGPIHLLKYAYLVDVEHARHHDGRTFTGIEWQFHSFGPWSVAAHAIIATAVAISAIEEYSAPSAYGDGDYRRWSMTTEAAESLEAGTDLPVEVRGTMHRYVRQFGSDTSSLLHHIYATEPLIGAAPGEPLDFTRVAKGPTEPANTFVPLMQRLTTAQKAEFTSQREVLRSRFKNRHGTGRSRQSVARERRDPDFARATAWVNSLAGPAFPDGDVEVEFDGSIWRSESRQGHAKR